MKREYIKDCSGGEVVACISDKSVAEINKLGFCTRAKPVIIPQKTVDYITRKRPHLTLQELKDTIESPTEILPNIGTKEAPYRSRSVLFVRKNGHGYVSIVEIKPAGENNVLWNFWQEDIKTFERYLEKFRKAKAQILVSGGRPLPHIPLGHKTEGKPESLSGSQTENLGFNKYIQNSDAQVKGFVGKKKQKGRDFSL